MESSNHLRALAHPVRLRILSLLTGGDLSAADVARKLEITHANALVPPAVPGRCRRARGEQRGEHPRRSGPALPAPLPGEAARPG